MLNSSADTDWYAAGKVGPAVKGSVGAELVDLDGLLVKEGDYKLVKTRFSAFFATHLHSLLQGAGINNLIIYHCHGCCYTPTTDIYADDLDCNR
uniref:Isochorismatase-like domain-containing protein n=1 Tax=Quercus lobata TaxID=97700 RepID=A0A7N2KVJ1_QUELO